MALCSSLRKARTAAMLDFAAISRVWRRRQLSMLCMSTNCWRRARRSRRAIRSASGSWRTGGFITSPYSTSVERVDRIRLRQAAAGAGEVSNLTGVDANHGQSRTHEFQHDDAFVPTGRFENDQVDSSCLESSDELLTTIRPGVEPLNRTTPTDGEIKLRLGNINACGTIVHESLPCECGLATAAAPATVREAQSSWSGSCCRTVAGQPRMPRSRDQLPVTDYAGRGRFYLMGSLFQIQGLPAGLSGVGPTRVEPQEAATPQQDLKLRTQPKELQKPSRMDAAPAPQPPERPTRVRERPRPSQAHSRTSPATASPRPRNRRQVKLRRHGGRRSVGVCA